MNIAVDARPLCIENASGIPTYCRGLLNAIAKVDRENHYFLYAHRDFRWEGPGSFRWSKRTSKQMYGTVWLETLTPSWMRQDKIDIFWGTQHVLPLWVPKKVRRVLTMHDLIYRRHPETMALKNLCTSHCLVGPSVRRADVLIADTQNTARDLSDLLHVDSARIQVVYLGRDEDFKPTDNNTAKQKVREFTGHAEPFLLTVGTLEPRKNLAATFRAFRRIADRWPHALYVSGSKGWKMDSALDPGPGLRERVRFLGYAPRSLMPALYSAADVFLFPSLYEGFGIPVLEALACGTPVVSSNTSSLPEIGGDAALYMDPLDVGGFASNIERVLSDAGLRSGMIQRGLAHAEKFRWDEAARKMMDIFRLMS